jgi:hypothetical protein
MTGSGPGLDAICGAVRHAQHQANLVSITPAFTERRDRMVILDRFSATYIKSAAEAENKTPAEIIGAMVREKIAADLA